VPLFFNFPNDWIAFLAFFTVIMVFIGISEVARNILKMPPEVSRKFVHVMVGILVSLAPFFLQTKPPMVILGVIFIILNYVAIRKGSLKGMHTRDRVSFGTVYFPIAFTILVLFFWDRNIIIFIVSMLVLAVSDTLATLVGEKVNSKSKFILWFDKKSWPGSIAFFLSSVLVIILSFPLYTYLLSSDPLPIIHLVSMALFASLAATLGEAVSKRGSDNLTLTLAAALAMDMYLFNLANGTLITLMTWFSFSAVLGYGAFKLKSLSVSGGFGAFLLGVFMFGTGGWATMLPLIGFFVLSSLLSKISDRSSPKDAVSSKGSQRDIVQVYANGGIPLIFALVWYITNFRIDWLYWGFLASLAAATADTWETEIGSYSKKLPLNILTWKRVEKGYSGGVSLIGTLGGLIGATVIALIAVLLGSIEMDRDLIILIVLSGFFGSIIDSILGASIQAKFQCVDCKKPTEKLAHCGQETRHVSGFRWFDNDWVNVAGTLSAGLIFMLVHYLMW